MLLLLSNHIKWNTQAEPQANQSIEVQDVKPYKHIEKKKEKEVIIEATKQLDWLGKKCLVNNLTPQKDAEPI